MCCISDMVGHAQPAFGVVIEQVAQSLNIRTILSFPPEKRDSDIAYYHDASNFIVGVSIEPLSRSRLIYRKQCTNMTVTQVNCAHKVPVLRNQEYFFYYHPDICLNIYLKCFVFP